MDLFEIPDDYKPEKPLTDQQADEITNYLKGHPLFLKQLPEDISTNQHLVALQQLKDQTPEEQALALNINANRRLMQGPNSPYYMRDAYQKYCEAIKLKCSNNELNAKLHCNRASINLKYKNYGKVIQDCKMSLQYDPKYAKAYYRMAKAYIAVKKYDQCIQLLQNHESEELVILKKEALKLKQQSIEYKNKIENVKVTSNNKIQQYFTDKKWKLLKRNQQLPEGVQIRFIDDKISIPLVIIYPQFNQFDLIAQTTQQRKLSQCLKELFANPLPWDTKGQYNYNTIEIFAEIQQAVLLKLPKQATVAELAARVPIRGALEIHVITNNKFSQYYKSQHKIY